MSHSKPVILVVLIISLPTILLEMFLVCNIAAAILLLLVTLAAKRPLDICWKRTGCCNRSAKSWMMY